MDLSQPTLSCSEVEFLSEHSTVTIVPNFKEAKLFFLTVSIIIYIFYILFRHLFRHLFLQVANFLLRFKKLA